MLRHSHPELNGASYVVFADAQRRYTDASEGACALLGYTRKEMLTKSVEDVSYKIADVPQIFAQYLKKGMMEGDYVVQHKDGSAIPIHFRAFTFPDGCNAAIWDPIKDWREPYLSALLETNPVELKRKVEIALSAVERARNSAHKPELSADEQQALRDAKSALATLARGAAG
ncbi:MAG TPA: PAS domain-containing protein [Candidatus Sulfotelmatobacter sp.]|nr:PAS domain-containing protein [Candidatus Sulfotelmatobacter sp.]